MYGGLWWLLPPIGRPEAAGTVLLTHSDTRAVQFPVRARTEGLGQKPKLH